jgi:flagellar motor switch protein FliM
MSGHSAGRRLSIDDIKPQIRVNFLSRIEIRELGSTLAGSLSASFTALSSTPWRITVDGITLEASTQGGYNGQWLRIESEAGSVSFYVALDRSAMSALCEATMGGSGAETSLEAIERPLSGIELELSRLIVTKVGTAVVDALAMQIGIPVSLFDGGRDIRDSTGNPAGDLVVFRFLLNAFSYSGELIVAVCQSELAAQYATIAMPDSSIQANESGRDNLQRSAGKAMAALVVSLGPETLLVEEIAALKPGKTVTLLSTTRSPVVVSSGGAAIFSGTLARAGEHLSVRLVGPVP